MKIKWQEDLGVIALAVALSLGLAGVIYADSTSSASSTVATVSSFCGKLDTLRDDTLNKKIAAYSNSYTKTTSSTVARNDKKFASDKKIYEKKIAWSTTSTDKLVKKEYKNFTEKSGQALMDYGADIEEAVDVRSSTVHTALDVYMNKVNSANVTMASNTPEHLRVLRADYDSLVSSTRALCDGGSTESVVRKHYNAGWKVLYSKYLNAKKDNTKTVSTLVNAARKEFLGVYSAAKKTYEESLKTARSQMRLEYDKAGNGGLDDVNHENIDSTLVTSTTPPNTTTTTPDTSGLPDIAFDPDSEGLFLLTRVPGTGIVMYVNDGPVSYLPTKSGIKISFLDENKNELGTTVIADLEAAVINKGDRRAVNFGVPANGSIKYMRAILDVDNAVAESNEGNNVMEKEI
ncbi:MAG TPA: CARDB domain-containing protein [Candidatus Magasanikbacteria bacterium]|nr:CARDB domain-containing protein [Candidatus Magasanikbacteria bacterium]